MRARRSRAASAISSSIRSACLLTVVVHPADVQDRDGARQVLRTARRWFPFIERIFADAGYQGPKMAKVVADTGCWTLQMNNLSGIQVEAYGI